MTAWKTHALESFVGIFGGNVLADDGEGQTLMLREKAQVARVSGAF